MTDAPTLQEKRNRAYREYVKLNARFDELEVEAAAELVDDRQNVVRDATRLAAITGEMKRVLAEKEERWREVERLDAELRGMTIAEYHEHIARAASDRYTRLDDLPWVALRSDREEPEYLAIHRKSDSWTLDPATARQVVAANDWSFLGRQLTLNDQKILVRAVREWLDDLASERRNSPPDR